MKICCSIFIFMFCLLCSSCVTTTSVMDAQNINYHNRWVVVPYAHHYHITHYRYPMTFRGTIPYSWRRYNHREHNPRYRKYERTHNYRINQRPSRGRK